MPPLPDELLGQLSDFVELQLGLCYPRARWPDLERGLRRAAPELGFSDAEECARWLVGSRRKRTEVEQLATHLTIGETYFFRDPKSFATLENFVLPMLVEKRRSSSKRLRIWSAGCCTGEEAYSIAMSVTRCVPDFADWHITILGTDVNPQYLHKAAVGIYSQWSFRGAFAGIKERYFREVAPNRFEVKPEIKKLVTFSCLNFVEDIYPSLETNTTAMDIVFCRNVLMYFSRGHAQKVVVNLRRSLVEGGWFFASATEASPELLRGLERAEFPEASIYRRAEAPPPPVIPPFKVERPKPLPRPPAADAPRAVGKRAKAGSPESIDREIIARNLADHGHLGAALAECEKAIAANKVDPGSHYLRGVILQEQGELGEAAKSLRAAIYLDPKFVIAHFAMGNLMLRLGRHTDAVRTFETARTLLESFAAETVLPHSEGITAARLLTIVASMQEVAA